MREIIARLVCTAAVGVVLALAWLFAARHNPPPAAPAGAEPGNVAPAIPLEGAAGRGRVVYEAQGCAGCHAIAGRGNPRHPLDGIGARRSAEELRQRITATGDAAETMSGAVARRKAAYRELPADEMAALIDYLSSLSGAK